MISDVRAREVFRLLRHFAAGGASSMATDAAEKAIRAATREKIERASLRAFYAETLERECAALDEALVDEEPAA